MPTRQEVTESLERALETLIASDPELLEIDVNERALSHRLAIYLENEVAKWNADWNVDCEYNRDVSSTRDRYTKQLDLLEMERFPVTVDDEHATTVYPDIIVHRCRTTDNLLVIEMKKSSTPRGRSDFDKERKLPAYIRQLNYEYAAFVLLHVGNDPAYELEWIES